MNFISQFPRTEKHAFRDEAKESLFNLSKIYEQIDYNEDLKNTAVVTTGSFLGKTGLKIQGLYLAQIKTVGLEYLGFHLIIFKTK